MEDREGAGFGYGRDVDDIAVALSILDLTRSAIYLKDADAKFVWANRSMLERFGLSELSELRGGDDFDIHPGDQAAVYRETDRVMIETGVPMYDNKAWQLLPDGSRILIHTTKLPVRNRTGEIVGLFGVSADVTEPARVSAALADSEERYALAARATRDGIWDYDVRTDSMTISNRCAEIVDVPIAPGPIQRQLVEQRLGSTQFEKMTAVITDAMIDPSEPWSLDVDIVLADGSNRYVNVVGTIVIRDDEPYRIVGSVADVTAERERQAELRHLAHHDDLTGLRNRRALLDALHDAGGSLLYLDLDSFKVVNDSLGHQAGDELLVAVARRLRHVIDASDALYRLGGDEFAVLISHERASRTDEVARQVGEALRSPFDVQDLEIYSTASIGVVADLADDRDPTEVLRDADIALYEAKGSGKARAVVFQSAMRDRADAALELQMRIRRAVERSEFELHYQPITETRSGLATGVEALLRWRRSDGRLESPAVFLPHLEESKLIVPVGRWVIDAACAQMAAWRAANPAMSNAQLALNVSRVQFDAPDLVETLAVALERHELAPEHLVVEITESAVTQRNDDLRSRLDSLRGLGVRVAIDDFGVGQSSLSSLHDIPADILKIDRSFIERVASGADEPITRSVLAIARSLGMTTVAEGVETSSQHAWLREHECDRLQGYLISRPLPPDDICAFFDAH